MAISLAPDPTTVDPNAPPKPLTNASTIGLAPTAAAPNLTAAGTPATAPLSTEYPSAPSTTGTPQNRLGLATTAFDTFAKSTAPQYTADLRQATQQAAGNGQEGSGQLRTTYGNLANQRALALDTERSNLVNAATTGTIADQQANQGLGIQQQNANTAQTAAVGNLGVAQGTLGLQTGEATGTVNGQQTLAAKTAATSANQTQQQIDLSKLSEADQTSLAKAGLTGIMQDGTQTLQAKTDAINAAVAQGQLTNAQAQTAINALSQQSQATTAAGQLQLAKDQLTQTGTQFGLSQAQNLKLAQLADATQNRQIDVTTAQGQNALLVQLAQIIGGPTGSLDPNFVATIMKALGFAGAPPTTSSGTSGGTTGTSNTGTGSGPPTPDGKGGYVDSNGNPVTADGKPVKQATT